MTKLNIRVYSLYFNLLLALGILCKSLDIFIMYLLISCFVTVLIYLAYCLDVPVINKLIGREILLVALVNYYILEWTNRLFNYLVIVNELKFAIVIIWLLALHVQLNKLVIEFAFKIIKVTEKEVRQMNIIDCFSILITIFIIFNGFIVFINSVQDIDQTYLSILISIMTVIYMSFCFAYVLSAFGMRIVKENSCYNSKLTTFVLAVFIIIVYCISIISSYSIYLKVIN